MKELTALGGAYTIMPLHAVHRDIEAGKLQSARITEPVMSRAVLLASSTQRPVSRASREVMRLVRDEAKRLAMVLSQTYGDMAVRTRRNRRTT